LPRPQKCRRVSHLPDVTCFKPTGIHMIKLEQVRLSIEEAEAIRLKDLENLEQEQAAEHMNVSRPTFQRVLASGRKKVADALLNGKALKIEGGNFEMRPDHFKCLNGYICEVPFKVSTNLSPQLCPTCNLPESNTLILK
jgi:predicted DNA-binding protein (UPF0251 family)